MESYLRRRDLPRMFRDTSAVGKQNFHLFELANTNCKLARGVLILNTSENLEGPILAHIRPLFPATYAVGPLHSLVAVISSTNSSASLLPEDHSAIAWLDAQPDRSVVYVSFGSIVRLSPAEFLEFWHGFVDSGHRFLWVMRKDLVDGWEKPATKEEERVRMVAWAVC
ncbi:hypothetical protein HPP92_018165 [Vanilla planifolia]|uniref:Uncharacterized protein n=1 Tax=Vanilla planifolia TaxID=51239 RepID=A0A835UN39_VANPL|nr:hypothetical protein HPP92_018165 [Vanilla planifolia]